MDIPTIIIQLKLKVDRAVTAIDLTDLICSIVTMSLNCFYLMQGLRQTEERKKEMVTKITIHADLHLIAFLSSPCSIKRSISFIVDWSLWIFNTVTTSDQFVNFSIAFDKNGCPLIDSTVHPSRQYFIVGLQFWTSTCQRGGCKWVKEGKITRNSRRQIKQARWRIFMALQILHQ